MDLVSDATGALGDAAVAVEEFAEDFMATRRENKVPEETEQAEAAASDITTPIPSSAGLVKATEFSWGRLLSSFSINLILPFINGLMLGLGEIIAHEIGFHYNWVGAKIYRPKKSEEQKTKFL